MYRSDGMRNLDLRLRRMGRNGLEGGGSISEATKDDGRWRKCDERQREVVEVIEMCARAAEECCVLKHVFGGWNGYLRINDIKAS